MAEPVKEADAGVAVPVAAAEEKQTEAKAAETEAAPATTVRLTDDELLVKHFPRYFYDEKETLFPIDLNRYTVDKSEVDGCNGVATPSKDGENTWLIYMNYYLFDGGVAKLGGLGDHKYDLEIVIVEINRHQNVSGVFYGPHSGHEHMWIRNKDDVKEILDEAGRPRVYVSLGKHASYPLPGKVTRLFGLGTDNCENPRPRDRPLFILDHQTRRVDKIDGEFAGPKRRIRRDWSVAPAVRIKDVPRRMAVPPAAQVQKELSKLAFWR